MGPADDHPEGGDEAFREAFAEALETARRQREHDDRQPEPDEADDSD